MASLIDICEGLETRLATLADVQSSAYMLAQPTPPTLQVVPEFAEWHRAFVDGLEGRRVTVQGIVPLGADIAAQRRLYAWLDTTGAESVKAAIEADRTLGGLPVEATVTGHNRPQPVAIEGRGLMLVVEWTVEIIAKAS